VNALLLLKDESLMNKTYQPALPLPGVRAASTLSVQRWPAVERLRAALRAWQRRRAAQRLFDRAALYEAVLPGFAAELREAAESALAAPPHLEARGSTIRCEMRV
jgi:hypothetical protein